MTNYKVHGYLEPIENEETKVKNNKRKTLKVSEEIQNKIKSLSYIKNIPMYEVIDIALDNYIERLNDKEKKYEWSKK